MSYNISAGMETVTPTIAQHMLDNFAFSLQRTKRPDHIKELAQAISASEFVGNTIRLVSQGGHWNLLNGQHTLQAIVDTGCDQLLNMQREYVDTEAELKHIYAVTDTHKIRTIQDEMRVYGVCSGVGIRSTALINSYGAAIRFIHAGFQIQRGIYNHGEVVEMMLNWEFALPLFEAMVKETNVAQRSYRRDILCVGLATYRYVADRDRVNAFWGGMATDDRLGQYDPRKKLRHWLSEHTGRKNGGGSTSFDIEYGARAAAAAWNAYWNGHEMHQLRVHDHRAPMVLLGTPYK